jgi:hypothetical protein
VPGPLTPKDRHWEHTASAWWFDMAMLGVLCVGYLTFVRWKIRLKSARDPALALSQHPRPQSASDDVPEF